MIEPLRSWVKRKTVIQRRRGKVFILSLLVSGALGCLLTCALGNPVSAQPKPGPSMQLKETSRDFKEVLFSMIPGRKDGFRGFLRLKTNYPERPYVTVYIYG